MLIAFSFMVFYSGTSVIGIIFGIIFIDIGLQRSIYLIKLKDLFSNAEARNRMNTVFMSLAFRNSRFGL
jgi:hypothetical protein